MQFLGRIKKHHRQSRATTTMKCLIVLASLASLAFSKSSCVLAFVSSPAAAAATTAATTNSRSGSTRELFLSPSSSSFQESLWEERYQRARDCSLVDFCSEEERQHLQQEFPLVFEHSRTAFMNELESDRREVEGFTKKIYAELSQRINQLETQSSRTRMRQRTELDYEQENKSDWEDYLHGMYGSAGLAM